MEVPQIEKTQDYSIFKYVDFNREREAFHIKNLKKIVLQENLLHLHPILVNEKMEVIDGQHRLEVCKELNLPVFYIKSTVSYNHILNSNLFQKKLSLEDVIKFYSCKDKNPSYVRVYEYLKMLQIKPKCFFGLILGGMSKPILDFIKSGKFEMPSDEHVIQKLISFYVKFMGFVREKRIKPISMFTCSDFTISLRNLVLSSAFNESVFFSKLENRWFELKPQVSSKEWTRQMIEVYNWKNQNPISVKIHGSPEE